MPVLLKRRHRDKIPIFWQRLSSSWLKGKGFFLNAQGLIWSSKYYTQVQGQLLICEKDFCDFVGGLPEGYSYRGSTWILLERLIKKLASFYIQHFLPEFITHHLQCTPLAKTSMYCFCQKEEHGKMIQCENPTCKYVWFHFSCIGLKQSPKESWYCPECNSQVSVI